MAKADTSHQPDWWAPVWQGLVLDNQGKHYRKMKSALWLLMYFILCANRSSGTLKRKVGTISRHMDVKARTIRLWLDVLRDNDYIATQNSGRCLIIEIKKWKTYTQRHPYVTQSDIVMPGRVTELCQSVLLPKGRETWQTSEDSVSSFAPNDKTLKKDILTNNNVAAKTSLQSRDVAIALEICQAFKDKKNLPLYLAYVKKYEMGIIKQAFKEAMKPPANKIKKTRGALFNYLVQYYAGEHDVSQNHRH
ncbi:MAG TPA: hypothetical protein P5040_00265 [Smithella sp.]|nr:hypothetical protein [Smithella sp.]